MAITAQNAFLTVPFSLASFTVLSASVKTSTVDAPRRKPNCLAEKPAIDATCSSIQPRTKPSRTLLIVSSRHIGRVSGRTESTAGFGLIGLPAWRIAEAPDARSATRHGIVVVVVIAKYFFKAFVLYFEDAAAGGSDDWMMGVAGADLSYTMELPGGRFDPPPSRIASVGIETFEAFKIFQQFVEEKYVKKSLLN
ncbi:hypothetical protein PV325_009324 [Microctonus aethiopoides]|nr:hypothetical protein PV325_009324 [Microctonus aethiopoides]